jgi:hypothetical protein
MQARRRVVSTLMLSFQYRGWETCEALGEEWNCEPSTVEQIACEAKGWHALIMGDDAQDKLRDALVASVHDRLSAEAATGSAKNFAEIAKVALPLAGVATGGPSVSITFAIGDSQIKMTLDETRRTLGAVRDAVDEAHDRVEAGIAAAERSYPGAAAAFRAACPGVREVFWPAAGMPTAVASEVVDEVRALPAGGGPATPKRERP